MKGVEIKMRIKMKVVLMTLVLMAGLGFAEGGQETRELRDFIGAVYDKRGSWTLTSGENALSDRGCIRKVGENYFTPEGCYRKIGNTYVKSDEDVVVTTGSTWLSGKGAAVSTGTTYLGTGKNKVSTGSTILDAEDEK